MKKKILAIFSALIVMSLLIYLVYDYFKYGIRIEDIPELYSKVEEYLPSLHEPHYGKYIENYKTFTDIEELGMYQFFDQIHVYVGGTFVSYYIEDDKLWHDSNKGGTYKFIFRNNELVEYEINQLPKHILREDRNSIRIFGDDDYIEKVKKYYGEELYNTIFTTKIEMKVKEGTLTNSGVTVIIEDKNVRPYYYGNWFRIDKKVDSEWQKLTPINEKYKFTEGANSVGENKILELDIDWLELYGELEPGEYKLVKELYGIGNKGKYFWVEFVIE